MDFTIGIIVGFFVSLVLIKRNLTKTGAGNCKMCKSCSYLLDYQKHVEKCEAESAQKPKPEVVVQNE